MGIVWPRKGRLVATLVFTGVLLVKPVLCPAKTSRPCC